MQAGHHHRTLALRLEGVASAGLDGLLSIVVRESDKNYECVARFLLHAVLNHLSPVIKSSPPHATYIAFHQPWLTSLTSCALAALTTTSASQGGLAANEMQRADAARWTRTRPTPPAPPYASTIVCFNVYPTTPFAHPPPEKRQRCEFIYSQDPPPPEKRQRCGFIYSQDPPADKPPPTAVYISLKLKCFSAHFKPPSKNFLTSPRATFLIVWVRPPALHLARAACLRRCHPSDTILPSATAVRPAADPMLFAASSLPQSVAQRYPQSRRGP